MEKDLAIELIRILPTVVLALIVGVLLVLYRSQVRELMAHIGSISAFGLKVELAQKRNQLVKASESYQFAADEEELQGVIRRAERIRDLLNGSRILWVDDQWLANANIYR